MKEVAKKNCKLPGCGVEFEDNTRNHNKEFCCDAHRRAGAVARKNEQLKGLLPEGADEQARETTLATGAQKQLNLPVHRASSVQLDPLGTFIKEQLEEKVVDLKEQIKKKDSTIEKLQSDLKEKEKEILDLQKAVEAKPSGLSGFMESHSGMLEKIVEHPKVGEGLGELFNAFAKKVNPLSPHAVELDKWMQTLSEPQRNDVLIMLQGLINLGPQKMAEKISEVARGLMEPSTEQTQQPTQRKRVGTGIGL